MNDRSLFYISLFTVFNRQRMAEIEVVLKQVNGAVPRFVPSQEHAVVLLTFIDRTNKRLKAESFDN